MTVLNRSLSKICVKGLLGGIFLLSSPFLPGGIALAQQADTEETPSEQSFRAAITTEDDLVFVNTLIKSTLVALNQANLTDNYSVLLELGSEEFQTSNSNASLSEAFSPIRESGLNFAGIVEFAPVFSAEPTLDEQDVLRVTGYFETVPRIEYGMTFLPGNGRFLVDGLSINILPATAAEDIESGEPATE